MLEDSELAATVIHGLPIAYHSVARRFDVCALGDMMSGNVMYAVLCEEQQFKQDEVACQAACQVNVQKLMVQRSDNMLSPKCFKCGKTDHFARNCWAPFKDCGHQPGPGMREERQRHR